MEFTTCPILTAKQAENQTCSSACSWYRNGRCLLAEVADGLAEIAQSLKAIDIDLASLDHVD